MGLLRAFATWTSVPAEMWKQSLPMCDDSLPTNRQDGQPEEFPSTCRWLTLPLSGCHISLFSSVSPLPSSSFHPLPTSLNQPHSLQRSSKNEKKKATVSLKPHSARRAAEPVWKSLSHWLYFSSEWPGLLALGSFRSDFGRRQTVISPLIHFNQQ